MSTALDEARAALRARQGPGARYDAVNAPAHDLDLARRGTAYFARLLNNLPDEALDGPSARDGVSRRQVIAYVGYHARLLSELVAWGRTGETGPFPRAAIVASEALEFGIVQPTRALRALFEHSAVHLTVEWRDLSDSDWDQTVVDLAGTAIRLSDTPRLRAELLWTHAIDLKAGGRTVDIPMSLRSEAACCCLRSELTRPADRGDGMPISPASLDYHH